ncbi:MAG: transcriptional regulator [Myxococcales bacterium]|nr:transcriptional regulator [Myxococcales bacterium]|tara:strand:- start:732 stop:2381 length:1650 start_codon:yes stop_codon:yes gene_type:complete
MSFVLFYRGDRQIARLPLLGRPIRLGSSPAMDFSLPDAKLPASLCEFEPVGLLDYRVKSLIETGLVMNGRSVKQIRLDGGEELEFGEIKAVYHRAPLDPSDWASPEPEATVARRTGTLKIGPNQILGTQGYNLVSVSQPELNERAIGPDGVRIGARADNDIVVEDPFASGHHCMIFWQRGLLRLKDLDSTNGTRVNGVAVQETELAAGFQVTVGETVFEVRDTPEKTESNEVQGEGPWRLGRLVTQDAAFAKTFRMIEKIAAFDATVCIFGESGTGKELVAEAIHHSSPRKNKTWVPMNCAAIPANLIESQLFGHEKGAFTGADKVHIGAFEQAQNGTLFLDEIGELPLAVQAKLLRVLETGRVRRLGGQKEINLNFRLVVATHRDLPQAVAQGHFREDLLHRLYVLPLELPPLRDRLKDINFLARHFLTQLSPSELKYELSEKAEALLTEHAYSGNVRELRNVIQRAIMLADGPMIETDHIVFVPSTLQNKPEAMGGYLPGMTMEEIERQTYAGALKIHKNAAAAAKALGVPKTTFWRRAKQLHVTGG